MGRYGLSRKEINAYHKDGFLGPFNLFSPKEAEEICKRLKKDVFKTDDFGKFLHSSTYARHQDVPFIYDICTSPLILDRLRSLYGADLLLWNADFWIKEPNCLEVPWHQDTHYWKMDPPLSFTVWIALTSTTKDNGCLHIVRGSHLELLPHVNAPESVTFDKMADLSFIDESNQEAIELDAGQFVLFNDRIVHKSPPNITSASRISLVVRFSLPLVKLCLEDHPVIPKQKVFLVSGKDEFNFNDI